jgi:hypothetical protein
VYVFSGTKVVAEYENGAAPSSPTREYIYAGSQLLATLEGDLPPFSAQSIIRHSPGILLPLNRGKSQAAARREP